MTKKLSRESHPVQRRDTLFMRHTLLFQSKKSLVFYSHKDSISHSLYIIQQTRHDLIVHIQSLISQTESKWIITN